MVQKKWPYIYFGWKLGGGRVRFWMTFLLRYWKQRNWFLDVWPVYASRDWRQGSGDPSQASGSELHWPGREGRAPRGSACSQSPASGQGGGGGVGSPPVAHTVSPSFPSRQNSAGLSYFCFLLLLKVPVAPFPPYLKPCPMDQLKLC